MIKINEKARKFITEYEKLCRKYKLQIQWADEREYYLETEPFNSDITMQIDCLLFDFVKGEQDE